MEVSQRPIGRNMLERFRNFVAEAAAAATSVSVSRPEGFTAEVEGPRSHSGLQRVSEQFEEGRKGTECQNPFTKLSSETAGKVYCDLSIKAVDPNFAQDSEIKISQLSHLPNITSTAVGKDMSSIMDRSTYSNAHQNQFAGSSLSNTASHSIHGSCVDVVNNLACDTLSGNQSSIHSHVIKYADVSSKDNTEITTQKGSKGMTLLDTTLPVRNRYLSERSVSDADSIGSFNLSPITPIPQSSLEANTGVYTITYFDSDDALEDPAVEEPENDDCVIQWTEESKSTQIDERPQSLTLDKDQNRGEVPREMDYTGIKEEVIPGYSSLWYVQGIDASKEEFDRLFNQEDKIMKSSKGGYLTRSSSEDSDVLSIIHEQDEEAEMSMENVETREEHILYDAYSASEGGITDALKPNNKSAFDCKKQPSHFLDIPEIRDSSSVLFAEHSVKINQEVSNEESFISLDLSNIPDISLDDILAVNRKMFAVGDSDDGDLEEILAYCMGSCQESQQQHKELPKPNKSSTSDTDIASLDISQKKKATREHTAEKEQVYLSEVFQHPHEQTVVEGKEFSTRCFVEPSLLNENACTSDDTAKSVSHKMFTLQHPKEVSAKSVSAKMDTPQQPTEVSARLVSAKMDTPQQPTEVCVKSVSAKMDTPQHPTEVSVNSVSTKMGTPQHITEVSAKSVSVKMGTPQHPKEVSVKSVSAKMDTPQHTTEVSAKSVSAKMDTPQHPTEVSAKSLSAMMDATHHPKEVSAKSVSAKMGTMQHPAEVSVKSVSAEMDTPQHPTEVSAKSVSAKMDTPQQPTELSVKSVSAKMDTPQHPKEVSAKSVSAKMDTPQHPTEVSAKSVSAKMDTPQHPKEVSAKSVSAKMDTPQHPTEVSVNSVSAKMDTPQHPTEVSVKSVSAKMDTPQHPKEVSAKSVSAKMDTPQHPTEVSVNSVSAKMDTPQHPTEVSVKSVSAKMDTPQHPTEVSAKSLSAMMDATHHPKEVSAKSVSAKMDTPQNPTEVSVKSVSAKMDTPQHPKEVSSKSMSAKMDTIHHPKEVSVKSVSAKMGTMQHPTEVTDFKDDSISVNDEKSLSQVIAEHPDEVVRECKEEKQTHDITAVHLYSECDNKSNLISDLIIEHDQFSEHLSKNSHRTPTDQSSERLEHQISVDQSTSERQKSQISIDQDTRVAPHEEDVIEQEEQVVRDKTISTNDLEVSMNKLPHERTVIEESNVVCDPEKSSKNTAEWSLGYLSLESHVIDSVIISEQMFLPECIDYVIQPPEEFSDVDHMAPSTACHSVASQQDGDDLHQHQVSQQDADDLHQHQPLQQDADYLSTHVSEDAADAEIGLNVKDPQTLEKVETQKRGEKWDDMHVNKANIVLTLSSGLDSCSEEFVGKIGKKENIVNETDSAFHPDQNLADAQDGKEGLFSFQESSKACFMIPMIGADMVETEKRTAPVERSESSASQDDSGHVSLPTSVDHTPEHKRTDSGYSQSSIPSTRSTATDRSEEEDIDTLVASAKSNFGSRGNLLSVIADSRESIVSYYSDAGDISHSNIPVTGEVLFGLNYNYKTGMLEIAVKQCKAIAPADTKRKRSDPYVKTYLLPDKTRSGKRKTKVKKHTLSPIFDEVLKYSVSKSELENRTLWLSVWHNDRFGRNDFLGEVTINFDYYKFDDPTPRWYPLQERMDSQQPSMLTYKGDLILSICFVTTPDNKKGQQNVDRGQLHVMIKEAHNLTAVKSNGYSDPFCKGYLLPERHRNSKQKTPVVKKNCNPVWNYKMVFEDMSRTELAERCLELTIWDHEKLASNDFLGGVRLNLGTGLYQGKLVDWMDSKGEEISLWQAILDRPNLWIDSTLILRPNMQKRKF
ncbi:hypothetical protein ACJMK2_028041 [Sinanodonta woodiana]|uniref:C2 domain-containing protein n=1 Tax=Sinanodonta woodiana TaxID=1069815 RepID=A0ABD3X799_SINWO